MEFGERLKKLRLGRGWAQSDLAHYAEIRQGLVSNLEIGKNVPTLTTLHKLRAGFGCSWNTLLGDL